jgi:hypothetical protein
MAAYRSSDSTTLGIRIAAIALGLGAIAIGAYSLATRDVAVANYLASGETAAALRAGFESRYLSTCVDETKHSMLAGAREASAQGIESHCSCMMDSYLRQAEVEDVRAMLERGEATSHGQLAQARARDRCLDELTS